MSWQPNSQAESDSIPAKSQTPKSSHKKKQTQEREAAPTLKEQSDQIQTLHEEFEEGDPHRKVTKALPERDDNISDTQMNELATSIQAMSKVHNREKALKRNPKEDKHASTLQELIDSVPTSFAEAETHSDKVRSLQQELEQGDPHRKVTKALPERDDNISDTQMNELATSIQAMSKVHNREKALKRNPKEDKHASTLQELIDSVPTSFAEAKTHSDKVRSLQQELEQGDSRRKVTKALLNRNAEISDTQMNELATSIQAMSKVHNREKALKRNPKEDKHASTLQELIDSVPTSFAEAETHSDKVRSLQQELEQGDSRRKVTKALLNRNAEISDTHMNELAGKITQIQSPQLSISESSKSIKQPDTTATDDEDVVNNLELRMTNVEEYTLSTLVEIEREIQRLLKSNRYKSFQERLSKLVINVRFVKQYIQEADTSITKITNSPEKASEETHRRRKSRNEQRKSQLCMK